MAILGLILGIVGLVGGIICPFLFPLIGAGEFVFVVIAVVGIVISAIGMKKKKGAATAGLVLSIIAVILSLIFAFACTMGRHAAGVVSESVAGVLDEEAAQQLGAELESAFNQAGEALDGVDFEGAINDIGAAVESAVNGAAGN